MSDESIKTPSHINVGVIGSPVKPTTFSSITLDPDTLEEFADKKQEEDKPPELLFRYDSCSSWNVSDFMDSCRWGRARREVSCKLSTSKASIEQKRQKKARKLQRKLKKQRS